MSSSNNSNDNNDNIDNIDDLLRPCPDGIEPPPDTGDGRFDAARYVAEENFMENDNGTARDRRMPLPEDEVNMINPSAPSSMPPPDDSSEMLGIAGGAKLPDVEMVMQNQPESYGLGGQSYGIGAQFRGMAIPMSAPQLQLPQGYPAGTLSGFGSPGLPDPTELINPSQQKQQKQLFPPPGAELKENVWMNSGWNLSNYAIKSLPRFFPMDMVKQKLPISKLNESLENMMGCFKSLSIQAQYCNNPLKARVRTMQNIDLEIFLWKSEDGKEFYLDLQRRKGDYLEANNYINKIVTAAVEGKAVPTFTPEATLGGEEMKKFEEWVKEKMKNAPKSGETTWMSELSSDNITRNALNTVHVHLASDRYDMRRSGVEFLSSYADLGSTLKSTAIPCALVLVAGKPCSEDSKDVSMCQDIRNTFLLLLLKRQYADHEQRSRSVGQDNDGDAFMEGDGDSYLKEHMNEVFHLALTALVNCLDVLSCFRDELKTSFGCTAEQAVIELMKSAMQSYQVGLEVMLQDLVKDCDKDLASAYMACKALRLVGETCPYLLAEMKRNEELKTDLNYAISTGDDRHELLRLESNSIYRLLVAP